MPTVKKVYAIAKKTQAEVSDDIGARIKALREKCDSKWRDSDGVAVRLQREEWIAAEQQIMDGTFRNSLFPLLDRSLFSNICPPNSFEIWLSHIEADCPTTIHAVAAVIDRVHSASEALPVKVRLWTEDRTDHWLFKGHLYAVKGVYSDHEMQLLILEHFDKERRQFERLRHKHIDGRKEDAFVRRSIPEAVRIEVWRRDGGKCSRCGSRSSLEYDHIVPVSKGGSNTARNVELLCEECNRSKSAEIR